MTAEACGVGLRTVQRIDKGAVFCIAQKKKAKPKSVTNWMSLKKIS
jgi:hypothetical protein